MLNLLYLRILVKLIKKDVLLSDLPKEEVAKLMEVKIKKDMSIEQIEEEEKKIIDSLAKEIGLLEAIKRIRRLITCNFREVKSAFLDTRTCADLNLFAIAASTFATKLKEIYKPNIYFILELEFLRLENNTFDRESFKNKIREEFLSSSYILSSEDSEEFSQTSLFGIETKENSNVYENISKSYTIRTSVMDEVKNRIRKLYSVYTSTNYIDYLVTILQSEDSLESEILIDLINSVKSELRRGQVKRKKFTLDANQLILEPVNK